MLLGSAMFSDRNALISSVDFDAWWDQLSKDELDACVESDDFRHWAITPVNAPILSADILDTARLDGTFLIRGWLLLPTCAPSDNDCFIEVTMPERIVSSTFIQLGDLVVERSGLRHPEGHAIPRAAIDSFGVYELYYVRGCADLGISVLREGLAFSRTKWAIANDLCYILRDEHRYDEAVDAFTIAIETGPTHLQKYWYRERARLNGLLGLREAQELDERMAESLTPRRHSPPWKPPHLR